jgi:hypothetical protein
MCPDWNGLRLISVMRFYFGSVEFQDVSLEKADLNLNFEVVEDF